MTSPEVRDMWQIPQNDYLTHPFVSVELLNDPIASAINTHCPTEIVNRKKHANSDNLTIDDAGIRSLINDKCYRSAIALTSRLLANYGQGLNQKGGGQGTKHSIHSLQLWYTRISLLIKIGEYDTAKKEAEAFGQLNNQDIFYDFTEPQEFKSKKGSLASFSFRLLLAAELPIKLGQPKEALHNLTSMLSITRKIKDFFYTLEKKEESEFWKEREVKILCSIATCSLHLKNYDLVHQTLNTLLNLPNLKNEFRYEVYSAWGKIYLQCGDIKSAEEKFSVIKPTSSNEIVKSLVNKGLVAVAQNDYNEAHKFFSKAHEMNKSNVMVMNNLAVCYLYNGKMHDAIKLYEEAIFSDPRNNLHETLLLNCATLYELRSNESKKKKIELLKIVNVNRADLEMSIELCLKL